MNTRDQYNKLQKEQINCPVCDHNQFNVMHDNDRYGMGVQTVICNKCSLIYINPRPTELEMSKFYKNDYRKIYESIEVPNEYYIKNGLFIPRAKFVIKNLLPYLKSKNSFLDIGCAEGTLLKLVEEKFSGLKTQGIEPSVGFGNYAKEHINGDVFVGTYEEYCEQHHNKTKFDVIVTTHVLEHILNPKLFLKRIISLMHNESILYIEVPNIMHDKVCGIGNIHIGHVLSLDPQTIKILLDKCSLKVVDLFVENLPSVPPSMAVICVKKNSDNDYEQYPSKEFIINKFKVFRKKVVGI